MLNKVVHNKGGLYNRLTAQINLMPFTLAECAQYAASRGVVMNRHHLLECYMVMGGVPYYWSLLHKELSLSQNVGRLFFADNAPLKDEFRYLFRSLFKRPEGHMAIIKALGIAGVLTDVSSWSCAADLERGVGGSQIDLLIDRRDHVINLCEMKYSTQEYAITKEVDVNVRHKVNDFRSVTGTKKAPSM